MKKPYYIVAPPYVRTSAGIRVLYRLCDVINKLGGSAFIYLRPHVNHEIASSPNDVAPYLNKKILNYHFENGLTPIVIYPETMDISKFSAPFKVRYVLNYDNYLFENNQSTKDNFLIAYSANIANKLNTNVPLVTINLPISDHNFYCPPQYEGRSGGVFYAGKYKYHFNGKTLPITDGMIEITRDRKDSQTPEQIRELFQTAEFFYSYEDSALAIEALLCECPVIYVPNEFFKETLSAKELDGLGYAWGDSTEQIVHAKTTVKLVRARYCYLLEQVNLSTSVFLSKSQNMARSIPYTVPFAAKYILAPSLMQRILDLIRFMKEVLEDRGILKALTITIKRLRSRRFKIY